MNPRVVWQVLELALWQLWEHGRNYNHATAEDIRQLIVEVRNQSLAEDQLQAVARLVGLQSESPVEMVGDLVEGQHFTRS